MENQTARNFIGLFTITASLIRNLSASVLVLGSLVAPSLAAVQEVEIVNRPAVDEDRVTVRIKVRGEGDLPITGLQDRDFRLIVNDLANGQEQEVQFRPQDWKSPKEVSPPPAWVVILLDFSNSMIREDLSGETKLEGAIGAIREYTQVLEKRAGNTQIAIIPFGSAPNQNCTTSYLVDSENDIDQFSAANDIKLQNYLNYLEDQTPCAATDLYTPLATAVDFFANRFPVSTDEENTGQTEPRLSIILLSDGYHSVGNEEENFQQLADRLSRNSNILVHTLGYGLTPEQLGAKYKLGRAARRSDLNTVSIKDREEFEKDFVDYDRLQDIAGLTGGLFAFSGDAEEVAASLQRFLDDLLGEYEITYTDPKSERGEKHAVQVIVESEGTSVRSDFKPYTIDVFGRSVPIRDRLPVLAFVLVVLAGGGALPFWLWAKSLKQET